MKNQSLSNSVLQQKLKKSEELRSALKEKIEKSESVRSDMSETIKRLQSFGASNGVLAQITNAVASKDEKSLIAFNKNVVAPYLSYIKSIQMPLSEDDKQMIIDKTISLAMIAVDMADTYEWDLNNREEQKINCGILNAQISIEEALSKAIQITDNPMVTPRWIRAMSTALASILSDTSNVIYSGYKL
ncbi:MAG: hypothetical protein MJZ16_11540 [Bacteroidales bacterium]|nr:hypothetical protein [Bacteroidales bacterium]